MSEEALVPLEQRKTNFPSAKLFMFIPILFLLKDKNSKTNPLQSITEPLDNIINSLNAESLSKALNPQNIEPKIATLKKIGPYMPESSFPMINKIVLTFEKINKVISLADFISTSNSFEPIQSLEIKDTKDRINKIINVLKDELPEDTATTVKPMLDLVTNIDKVKGILNAITSLTKKDSITNAPLEDIVDLVLPFLGESKKINKDKIKEMVSMFEMMKILNDEDNKEKSEDK